MPNQCLNSDNEKKLFEQYKVDLIKEYESLGRSFYNKGKNESLEIANSILIRIADNEKMIAKYLQEQDCIELANIVSKLTKYVEVLGGEIP